jgi:hypothetical protein
MRTGASPGFECNFAINPAPRAGSPRLLSEIARVNTLPRAALAPVRDAPRAPRGELVLDRYRLLEPLGSGGHGTVWAARDEKLRRAVALKRIPRGAGSSGVDQRRIDREALAAARLSHPAIVAFYEALSDHDAFYLVSELVDGESLAQRYATSRPDELELIAIGAALADALGHAHARGVVHRDVKPQNVIVCTDTTAGGAPAKLTDFGVALIADEQPLTRTGDVIGTLAYMSPEQAHGRPATAASDLYALALTLYEGFAGHNPLRGASAVATVRRLGRSVAPLSAARPDLPRRLSAAIDQALERDPARRGTVAELRDALDRANRHTITARMPALRSDRSKSDAPPLTPRGQRLVGAVAAAMLTAAAQAGVLGPHSSMAVVVAASLALLGVVIAPRIGWLLLGGAACGALALGGHSGSAVLLLCALAPVPLLLAGDPWLWSFAGLAPALGLISLAPAFPAVAARVGGASVRRRVGLALAGYWWLVVVEVLSNRRLLFGIPASARARRGWLDSPAGAFDHVLAALLALNRLAPALLWAVAVLVLPWLMTTSRGWWRALLATLWATLLVAVAAYLAARAGAAFATWVPGAVAFAAAVALSVHRGRQPTHHRHEVP